MTDLAALQAQGRCEQTCPSCGLTEAAGFYCTACTTPTGEPYWRLQVASPAKAAALAATRAKRHAAADRGSPLKETANPGPVA